MTDLQPVVATYTYKKEAAKAQLAAILQDIVTVYGSITIGQHSISSLVI